MPAPAARWQDLLAGSDPGFNRLRTALLMVASIAAAVASEWSCPAFSGQAIRKHAIASVMDLGTPDERAAYHLMHAYCRNRIANGTSTALLPGPQPLSAILPLPSGLARAPRWPANRSGIPTG